MRIEENYSRNAGHTAVQFKNKDKNIKNRSFFNVDNKTSFGYGSKYDSRFIKIKQIQKAPMERWGMLELIKKSGIELSREEKENMLIFGDIRGNKWAENEIHKLRYEFDGGN